MEQPEVVAALSTLGWLELIKRIGGFMVIVGVAIEVGGDWISTPFHKKVEDARQLELSRLSAETEAAKRDAAKATAETAAANERAVQIEATLEKERASRVAMLAQLRPRDFT